MNNTHITQYTPAEIRDMARDLYIKSAESKFANNALMARGHGELAMAYEARAKEIEDAGLDKGPLYDR